MKLDTHWSIKEVGHRPSEKSLALSINEIIELAKNMEDGDVIYTYHMEKQLNRIVLYGTCSEDIVVSIHTHGGGLDKTYKFSEIEWVLVNFEEVQKRSEEYGFKPDWE